MPAPVKMRNSVADVPRNTEWDGVLSQALASALALPATECIEVGLTTQPLPARTTAPHRGLSLTITALSAYRHPVAKLFAAAVGSRITLSDDLRQRIRSALQEALMNAVVHGNLGLNSGPRDTAQALAQEDCDVTARLAILPVARSGIRIEAKWSRNTLAIVVHDSGKGFKPKPVMQASDNLPARLLGSGRGLTILRACCDGTTFNRSGTAVTMKFHLSEKTP